MQIACKYAILDASTRWSATEHFLYIYKVKHILVLGVVHSRMCDGLYVLLMTNFSLNEKNYRGVGE